MAKTKAPAGASSGKDSATLQHWMIAAAHAVLALTALVAGDVVAAGAEMVAAVAYAWVAVRGMIRNRPSGSSETLPGEVETA